MLEKAPTTQNFDFRRLPTELRLRVLQGTHLGPPSTGGYSAEFEEMLIRDGKLDIDNFSSIPGETFPCDYRSWHGSSASRCRCRILPMALFLVDRQMYQEASEIFYSNAFLNFYGDDWSTALGVLRQITLGSQHRLRHLKFTITVAQCDGWGSGALASRYPEASYNEMARCYWDGGPRPKLDYQADLQAIVYFLANNTDLTKLRLEIDMGTCGWQFFDISDMLMWEVVDMSWFRFVYDLYIGVVTPLCSLKELSAIDLDLYHFRNLKSWLEREVMGCRNGYGELHENTLKGYGIPSWHNMDSRLEGSNYRQAS